MSSRVAVLATHPIQYYAPLFRTLAKRARHHWHVFYEWSGGSAHGQYDPGFGADVEWDIPMLDGYQHTFVPNDSRDPGTHHFAGIWSRDLISTLRAWRPDAVLLYGWNFRSHLNVLRDLHGHVPILFRGDSNSIDEISVWRRALRSIVLRWVYSRVDVALYVGQHNRNYYLEHGLRENQLRWAPHSIDNERFGVSQSREEEARLWREELGIGTSDVVFLYAGKFEEKKAPDLLLRTFLRRRRSGEHLVLAGSGALEKPLRELACGRRTVHFIGFQNQSRMPLVYRLGDVFVMPSRGPFETWGLAVNEAMASSRPVIACDRVGCAQDLVVNGQTGFTFSRENAAQLDRAMTVLASDPILRLTMGANAARHVDAWTIEQQAVRIEDAVEYVSALRGSDTRKSSSPCVEQMVK